MADFEDSHTAKKWRHYLHILRQMHISTHAAHACYFIVLSVFPTLVLIFGILRYTSLQPNDLLDLLGGILPEALLPYAWKLISGAYANTSKLVISVSALTAIWSAGRGVYGLQAGLNAVYGVHEDRGWLRTRIICAAYTFLFILVLLLTLVLNVFGNTILRFLRTAPGFWAWVDLANLRFFLLVLVQTLLFCAMFMFLPSKHHGFWESLPGALLGAFGWTTASGMFSVYVEYFPRYANIFGSVYAVALASLWLYVCVSIIFYGAVLNRILEKSEKNS